MKQGSKRNRSGFGIGDFTLGLGSRAMGGSFILNDIPDCQDNIDGTELIKAINIVALYKISNFI